MDTSQREHSWTTAGKTAILLVLAATLLLSVSRVYGDQQAQLTKQPSHDAYVASGRPNQSWPTLRTLWVGHDQSAGYGNERILLQFALAEVPAGSQIQSAKLKLYLAGTTPGDAPMNVVARRISNNWTESVTWNDLANINVIATPTAATQVGTEFRWYEWDLKPILQDWANNRPGGGAFSLLLQGNEASGQHERVFWSKDCSDADCGAQPGKRPVLVVDFTPPTPTPTPTPPALSLLYLRNVPSTAIGLGDEVTYFIDVRNGQQPLTDVEITNPVPAGVEVVIDQATPGPIVSASEIRWVIGALPAGATRVLSYKASRPTGTPTVTVIINSGAVSSGKFAGTPIPTMWSNGVTNPSRLKYMYLPLLIRH